ncbi:hypothetical protein HK102_014101, partial [Quaeritorhiza haematococci]
ADVPGEIGMTRSNNTWSVPASVVAKRTSNPIRNIVDQLKIKPNPSKQFISLALGDPTVFDNLKTSDVVVNEVEKQVKSFKSNGYPPSVGYEQARDAIARQFSSPEAPLTSKDVIITSGCSGALDLCIGVLANEGQNVLLPRPGFPLYQTLSESKGIEVRFYDLLPEESWAIDLAHVASLIDEKTAAIVINNPSNPCGSVFTEKHVKDILTLCDKYKLPIIADEIYADMVFSDVKFQFMARLTTTVPILSVGGLAKRWLVPGWRVGWILIHDRNNVFSEVRQGLLSLSQLILGANSLIQGALPAILDNVPLEFYTTTNEILEVGIDVNKFKDIENGLQFIEKLVQEEAVLGLPGECFNYKNYFRLVISLPGDVLKEALQRLAVFVERHQV